MLLRFHHYVFGFACLGLSACNGSTAIIKLMDAPFAGVTAVNIFIATVDVHMAGVSQESNENEDKQKNKNKDPDNTDAENNGWQTLEVNKTINLMEHQGEDAAILLGELSLPSGKITQIRLNLDLDEPQTVIKDNVDCAMDTSQVPTTGIKIIHPFKAFDSKNKIENEILLDFDLAESLTESGTCFKLKPVLHLVKVKANGKNVDL